MRDTNSQNIFVMIMEFYQPRENANCNLTSDATMNCWRRRQVHKVARLRACGQNRSDRNSQGQPSPLCMRYECHAICKQYTSASLSSKARFSV